MRIRKVLLCPFHCKARPSGVSLEPLGLQNISQVPPDRAKVGQSHHARKAFSVSLSVRPRSSKVRVQKVLLCPFHWKPRPSGVSLESPGLQNILQVPGNRAEVDQNHHAGNGLSAILSVLNLSRAIFRPRSSKVSVEKVLLCPFHCKPRPSGVNLECPGPPSAGKLRQIC